MLLKIQLDRKIKNDCPSNFCTDLQSKIIRFSCSPCRHRGNRHVAMDGRKVGSVHFVNNVEYTHSLSERVESRRFRTGKQNQVHYPVIRCSLNEVGRLLFDVTPVETWLGTSIIT